MTAATSYPIAAGAAVHLTARVRRLAAQVDRLSPRMGAMEMRLSGHFLGAVRVVAGNALKAVSDWRVIYEDGTAIIFERRALSVSQ